MVLRYAAAEREAEGEHVTVIPSQLDIEEASIQKTLGELHTCMPGEVVAVRSDAASKRQFVDVLPMLQRAVVDQDGEPLNEALPLLQMVPVAYVQGGGFFLSVPLRPGDAVLLLFAERSLDFWIEQARPGARSPVVPGDLAMHSLQGAIALPCGPRPRAALLEGVSGSDMVIGLENGTILMRFTPAGEVVWAEGTQFVALANLVATELSRLWTAMNAHQHVVVGGGGGTASAQTTPLGPAGSVAATKTKAT
jgi:hypothetical protein